MEWLKRRWQGVLLLFSGPIWKVVERAGDLDFVASAVDRWGADVIALISGWLWLVTLPAGVALILWMKRREEQQADRPRVVFPDDAPVGVEEVNAQRLRAENAEHALKQARLEADALRSTVQSASEGMQEHASRARDAEASQRRLRDEVLPEWQKRAERAEAERDAALAELVATQIGPIQEPLPPPDERLVILCRRYALPAYELVASVVDEVLAVCFSRGGWSGLAAHYYKYGEGAPAGEAAMALRECLEGKRQTSLDAEFAALYQHYGELIAAAWQFGHDEIALDQELLREWSTAHDSFMKELLDLAAGVNRDYLQTTLRSGASSREMSSYLKRLIKD